MPTCSEPDCFRAQAKGRGGRCEPCYRNQHRPRLRAVPSFGNRYESPLQRFVEAALTLADTDPEDDKAWSRNLERARLAARAWVKGE